MTSAIRIFFLFVDMFFLKTNFIFLKQPIPRITQKVF